MNILVLVILSLLNIPWYVFLFRKIFGTWAGFMDAVREEVSQDIRISTWWMVNPGGTPWNGTMAWLMLMLFVGLSGGAVYGEYWLLNYLHVISVSPAASLSIP